MPTSSSSQTIDLPADALRYVLLQRTGHMALPRSSLLYQVLARLCAWPRLRAAVALACRGREVKRSYLAELEREYEDIKPWLPDQVRGVLDIGCGIGGIDVMLFRHYGRASFIQFFMLDRTRVSDHVHYGFGTDEVFYNSLEVTERVLERNGIPIDNVHLREANGRIRIERPLDLVVSLLSWGFHYPVEAYLEQVHRRLRPGGRAILDVRRGTGGIEALRRRFARLATVSETPKKVRVAATR